MSGDQLRPVGETASWNFGRFDSKEATEALQTYANTTDDAERKAALATLQKIQVEQVPAIPSIGRPAGAEYSTKYWTGWPTTEDAYADPQPTGKNVALILSKLKPAK